jgi:2-hydroxychromene-2-carboxylate isomerase
VQNIDFYFSIGSTYTYLSVTRIIDVEKKHQVKFNWLPFSVRSIMKEMNNIPFPKEKINKVNYMWRDIERRAEGYGFFAKTPVPYPLTEFDLANKLAILGLKEGWGVDYIRLTYKRWFQEGKEPATEPNISEIFKELKIDKEKAIKDVNSSEIEKQYLKNTESARENKVFGSPSFIVNSEIFWGDDRMEDAITWSKKNE